MAGNLGRSASDFISCVVLFQSAPAGTQPDPSALRQQLQSELDAFARSGSEVGASVEEIEAARFALVAFADELVLLTSWAGHDSWAQEPLQQQIFGTQRAGNEFFERLDALRADQSDAREVYALCLGFGFQGKWAGRDADRRQILQKQLELLRVAGRSLDASVAGTLSPAAYEVEIDLPPARSGSVGRALAVWGVAAAVLFILLWGTLRFVASGVSIPTGA